MELRRNRKRNKMGRERERESKQSDIMNNLMVRPEVKHLKPASNWLRDTE